MTDFQHERLACAYFFAGLGLSYGIFTSRMPAIKQLVSATDSQIGFLLLAFGGASFCGLLVSRYFVARFGPKFITGLAAPCALLFLSIASLCFNYFYLISMALLAGLGTGLCDVAMNAQAMSIERRYHILCMSSLHASFSLGGVLGSLSGSLFAYFYLSPFVNFLAICGGYLMLWPLAYCRLKESAGEQTREKEETKGRLPFFVYLCGVMAMLCYVSEGSVGEWGSVLLHSVKHAPEDQAALVFACFCASMVAGRSYGDKLRALFTDFTILLTGSLLGALGMTIVLISTWPWICLGGYILMGIGFAPIVPILYSRVGNLPGQSLARVSSTVSIMAYTGMLFFPPFLGMLGQAIGLDNALWVIVLTCLGVSAGSKYLKS